MLPKIRKSKKLIYFDHAATTYLDPKVEQVMRPFWQNFYGNPSSLYSNGREAKQALDASREKIAKILNCRTEEIIFTAGGTESINLAIFGVVREYLYKKKQNPELPTPHIITSEIEHHAVLNSFEALQKEGVEVSIIPVNKEGFIAEK